MKKLLIALGFLSLITSCKESNELINLTDDNKVTIDSNYSAKSLPAAQLRNVYVEDITGVQCTNCPSANQRIQAMESANKGRIVPVAISPTSAGLLTAPFPSPVKYLTFRTKEGDQITSFLGSFTGLPTGDVDRKIFPAESKILIDYNKWQSYASTDLAIASPVNIQFVTKSYDPVKKIFDGDIKIIFTGNVTEATYMTIMLTENGIVYPQETAIDTNFTYVHDHVLRKTFTQYNGMLLGQDIKSAQTYVIHYRGPVDNSLYVINNLNLVAIIHHQGSNNEIIQAAQTSFQ